MKGKQLSEGQFIGVPRESEAGAKTKEVYQSTRGYSASSRTDWWCRTIMARRPY